MLMQVGFVFRAWFFDLGFFVGASRMAADVFTCHSHHPREKVSPPIELGLFRVKNLKLRLCQVAPQQDINEHLGWFASMGTTDTS